MTNSLYGTQHFYKNGVRHPRVDNSAALESINKNNSYVAHMHTSACTCPMSVIINEMYTAIQSSVGLLPMAKGNHCNVNADWLVLKMSSIGTLKMEQEETLHSSLLCDITINYFTDCLQGIILQSITSLLCGILQKLFHWLSR